MEEGRAALLASHGFAAFALAYFHAEGLRRSHRHSPGVLRDRLELAGRPSQGSRRWFRCHGRIPRRELVLLLGATFPTIKAVVAFVPSGVVWRGFGKNTEEIEGSIAAWTHNGVPVPSMPPESEDVELNIADGDPIPLTPYFLKSMESRDSLAHARIPVERIAGPVLMISGEADAMWPSTLLADIALESLQNTNHPYAFEHVSYPDAGHNIRAPYVPTTVTAMQHPVDGGLYALGGTPAGNARANEDSWRRVLAFLNQHLAVS